VNGSWRFGETQEPLFSPDWSRVELVVTMDNIFCDVIIMTFIRQESRREGRVACIQNQLKVITRSSNGTRA
jgi:hypothetical protein